MQFVLSILWEAVLYVLETLRHNLPILLIGIFTAGALRVYLDAEKMKRWLMNRPFLSVPATVAFGAFTPFCACGTMAVVLSMLATALPWAAIMAFLTSSPLMSPDEFILISGMIGVPFAVALTVASILIGLGSGYLANVLQKRTTFFDNQLRFSGEPAQKSRAGSGCSEAGEKKRELVTAFAEAPASAPQRPSCCQAATISGSTACCAASAPVSAEPSRVSGWIRRWKLDRLGQAVFDLGVKKILPMFAAFAAIGYLINRFIPSEWISAVFGVQSMLAVPLAAVVGLPLYVSGSAAIPLLQSLLAGGVSPGAMLAFLITGPGTSAGVLAGVATILKRRAIVYYVACLLVGAIVLGYLYDFLLLLF